MPRKVPANRMPNGGGNAASRTDVGKMRAVAARQSFDNAADIYEEATMRGEYVQAARSFMEMVNEASIESGNEALFRDTDFASLDLKTVAQLKDVIEDAKTSVIGVEMNADALARASEKLAKSLEKAAEDAEKAAKTFKESVDSLKNGINNVADAFVGTNQSIRGGSISGTISSIGGVIGNFFPQAGAAIGALGTLWDGIQSVSNEITKWNKQGQNQLNLTGEYNAWTDTAMKFEADFQSTFDNRASKEDYTAIQSALVKAQAAYGSDEYKSGLEASLDMMQRYGIAAAKASELYVKSIIDGGGSVDALTDSLDLLQKKVKEGELTMDEAIKQLETWSTNLSSTGGSSASNEALAQSIGSILKDSGVDAFTGNFVTKYIGKYGNDPGFNMLVDQYMQTNGGDMAQAYVSAAMDYSQYDPTLMYGSYDDAYGVINQKSYGGQSIMDLMRAGDTDAVADIIGSSASARSALWSMATAVGIGSEYGDREMAEQLTKAVSGTSDLGGISSVAADRRGASIASERWELSIKIDGPLAVSDLIKSVTQSNLDEGR